MTMEAIGYLIIALMVVGGVFPLLIGLLTIFYWVKPAKPPADESNRMNRIQSWWIGLTRTEVLASAYHFFRQDVMDNVDQVGKVKKYKSNT